MTDARTAIRELERGALAPEKALEVLTASASSAPTWAARVEASRGIGAIAGRAYGSSWPLAERAAFVLLELARETDTPLERAQILSAIGRAYRNVWLMPYVHARLGDDEPTVRTAAIAAAGGLGFPALEEALASEFLTAETPDAIRLAAIAALGRMGAESAATRIASFVDAPGPEALAALAALTEIRSSAGAEAAIAVLDRGPPPDLLAACVRYLAEIGHERVQRAIRSLARDDDAAQRIASSRAARAFQLERSRDAAERILSALTETDRATRAALARRLRTLPVEDVLAQAQLLLADDPEGVVQVVSEVRAPEVTRMLLSLAADRGQPLAVRARAAGSIEANEPWEQEALVELVSSARELAVRVAAAQTLGASAPLSRVLDGLSGLASDPAPELRGALLWALQLAARPTRLEGPARARAEAIVKAALEDPEAVVRRRAAYVAGNLDARSLVPALLDLARSEEERADLRLAAFVGIAEMAGEDRLADLVLLVGREDDPAAISAGSRALERAALSPGASRAPIARLRDRLPKLVAHADARVRAACARIAGLSPDTLPLDAVRTLAADASPRVREAAVIALGRLGAASAALASAVESALVSALDDDDALIQERAADALLSLGLASSLRAVLEYVTETADEAAAARIADRLAVPAESGPFLELLGAALTRIDGDHAAYETLLELKVRALDAARAEQPGVPAASRDVDADIAALFPHWTRLSAVRGFAPLAKSLRTAELLFGSLAGREGDPSASIVLWTKSLEGYLHAWLSPRMAALQRQPATLYEVTERVGSAWPAYQRWLVPRWTDPVSVGELRVDVPLRATVNVLRDLAERRPRPGDSPASVTEWARLMMFLAVDHPSGPRNVLEVTCRDPDHAVRLAHRLQVLALVRNSVTHRSVAAASTLAAFRTLYYEAFEDVTRMA
ncbi:MAG: hypothetical protein U0234_13820 [Sandaracinus sp.]